MENENSEAYQKFGGKFPPEEFQFHDNDTTREQFNEFNRLIEENSSEKTLDDFITKNPAILTTALHHFRTGNHKGWVLPKQQISIRIEHMYQRGMIPDFILGGQSSDGQEWWIVELKGANEEIIKIGKNGRIGFSNTVNKGICQLLEYIDYSAEKQSYLRDGFGLKNFREPNGLILVGRENEFQDERKRKLKASWNRLNKGKLEIRTFDWLGREFRSALFRKEDWEKLREKRKKEGGGIFFNFSE